MERRAAVKSTDLESRADIAHAALLTVAAVVT
jgi:hypothetical protein